MALKAFNISLSAQLDSVYGIRMVFNLVVNVRKCGSSRIYGVTKFTVSVPDYRKQQQYSYFQYSFFHRHNGANLSPTHSTFCILMETYSSISIREMKTVLKNWRLSSSYANQFRWLNRSYLDETGKTFCLYFWMVNKNKNFLKKHWTDYK